MKPIHEQTWKRCPGYVRSDAGVITIDDGAGRNVSARSTTLDAIGELPGIVSELRDVLRSVQLHPTRRERIAAVLRKPGISL